MSDSTHSILETPLTKRSQTVYLTTRAALFFFEQWRGQWGGGGGHRIRREGTHFWQAPTALDLPLPGGGGAAQEAHTH